MGAWSELAGVAEAAGLALEGEGRERSRSPLMRSRVLPFKAPPVHVQADAMPVPMATTPKRAPVVAKVQAPMATMPVPKALVVAPRQPAVPPSHAVIAKAHASMAATQEAADYAAAMARMEGALAPPAQAPPAPKAPSREYWRERPGHAEGRWGARGGKANPNVAWHSGLARAKREGPAAVAAYIRGNKKPPRVHQ